VPCMKQRMRWLPLMTANARYNRIEPLATAMNLVRCMLLDMSPSKCVGCLHV
jgi:hypothetical protein